MNEPPIPHLAPRKKKTEPKSDREKLEIFALVFFLAILVGFAGLILYGASQLSV